MGLQAYQQARARAESPRDAEYRLFGQVTLALMEAAKAPVTEISKRADALDWNRQMWATLAADCAAEQNALPPALRAQIISLCMWVRRQTSEVLCGRDTFDSLIEINRIMMQGLAGNANAAA
jgi:flagellar protein FlaF